MGSGGYNIRVTINVVICKTTITRIVDNEVYRISVITILFKERFLYTKQIRSMASTIETIQKQVEVETKKVEEVVADLKIRVAEMKKVVEVSVKPWSFSCLGWTLSLQKVDRTPPPVPSNSEEPTKLETS